MEEDQILRKENIHLAAKNETRIIIKKKCSLRPDSIRPELTELTFLFRKNGHLAGKN